MVTQMQHKPAVAARLLHGTLVIVLSSLIIAAGILWQRLTDIQRSIRITSDFTQIAHGDRTMLIIDPAPVPKLAPSLTMPQVDPINLGALHQALISQHITPGQGTASESYSLAVSGGVSKAELDLSTWDGHKYIVTETGARGESIAAAKTNLMASFNYFSKSDATNEDADYRYSLAGLSGCVLLSLMLTLFLWPGVVVFLSTLCLGRERKRYREEWQGWLLDTPSLWGKAKLQLGFCMTAASLTLAVHSPRRSRG